MEDNFYNFCVVYHKDDNDGVFSGAFLALYYIKKYHCDLKDIDLIGVDYNDLKTWDAETLSKMFVKYDYFAMTDVSLSIDLLELAYNMWGENFMWVDHHAPIINAVKEAGLDNKISGIRGIEHSALYHAYQILFDNNIPTSDEGMNMLIEQLSKWDSFTFNDDKEKELCQIVNKGITHLYKLNINVVISLFMPETKYTMPTGVTSELYVEAYNTGKLLLEAEQQLYDNLVMTAGDFWSLENGSACVLFMQGPTNSTMFRKATELHCQFGVVFKHNGDSSWSVSVYHTHPDFGKNFHIGNWCREKYNGGGHAGAGGFTITQEQFINMLTTKMI